MNKHIELVKKWLNDPESVTKDELEANAAIADAARDAAIAAAEAAWAAGYAAEAAEAAWTAARAAADTAHRGKEHEELTDE